MGRNSDSNGGEVGPVEGAATQAEKGRPEAMPRAATLKSIRDTLDAALLEQNRIEATYERLLSQSEAQLAQIIDESAIERRRHGTELDAAQTAAAEAAVKAADIEREAGRSRMEVADLQARLARIDDEIVVERRRHEIEIEAAQTAAAGARAEANEREVEAGRLRSKLIAKTGEADGLRARLAHAREETARIEGDFGQLSRELESRTDEIRNVQALLAEECARSADAQSRLHESEQELTHLRRDLKAVQDDLDVQAMKLRSLEGLWSVRMRRSSLAFRRRLSGWWRRVVRRKKDNPLFDGDFYLAAYPDVAESGVDPYWHYLAHGAGEGRNPNPMFETRYYLERYPDIAENGVNPLVHYFEHGAAELRDPHPLFATRWYVEQNPEIMQTGQNPLMLYLAAEQARRAGPDQTGQAS